MSKFARALQKMGLVQVDGQLPPAEDAAALEPSVAPDPAPVEPLPIEECSIAEAANFDEIYAAAGVPASPYPAEKLLKVLEGLRSMPEEQQRLTIQAIDQADDEWSIQDPINDATVKIAALRDAQTHALRQAKSIESHGQQQLAEIDRRRETAVAGIRQQIADLNALLEREVQKAAESSAAVQTEIRAAADAGLRATRQIEAEINKLQTLVRSFPANGEPTSAQS